MESLGKEPHVIKVGGRGWGFEEIGRQGACKLLEEPRLHSRTILCSNDRLAIGFLPPCYEKGLRVGLGEDCDLRVASHDDHPFSKFTCPSQTTAAHDYNAVSNRTVETLIELVESGGQGRPAPKPCFPPA